MQELPPEIISHICTLVPEEEGRMLVESSKIFSQALCGCETHSVYIKHNNVSEALPRLQQTLTYIRRLKPKISCIKIVFYKLRELPKWDKRKHNKIPSDGIWIHLHKCELRSAIEILKWFHIDVKVDFEKTNIHEKGELELYSGLQNLNKVETFIQSQEHIDSITNNPNVCKARELSIGFNVAGMFFLNLRYIDVSRNNIIRLNIEDKCDVMCIDVHKITHIHCKLSPNYFYGDGLFESLKDNHSVKDGTARIQHVYISCNNSQHIFHRPVMRLIYALLSCKNIEYSIHVIQPGMVALIYKMLKLGVSRSNIKYICHSREDMIIIRFFTLIYKDIVFDIVTDENYDIENLTTIDDLFDEMSCYQKSIWSAVYYARLACMTLNKQAS
jgi:hypothetical protein